MVSLSEIHMEPTKYGSRNFVEPLGGMPDITKDDFETVTGKN